MVQNFGDFTMLYDVVLFQRGTIWFTTQFLVQLKSVASPLHQWSALHSDWTRALRLPFRYWLESAVCEMWLVGGRQGRASLCCHLFFFFFSCSAVHMLEVNKPGVDIVSVLQFVKQRETETFLTFNFIEFIYETYCPNRADFGYYVL